MSETQEVIHAPEPPSRIPAGLRPLIESIAASEPAEARDRSIALLYAVYQEANRTTPHMSSYPNWMRTTAYRERLSMAVDHYIRDPMIGCSCRGCRLRGEQQNRRRAS